MNIYWVKLIETESGKNHKRKLLVSAYNRKEAEKKIHVNYTTWLAGMNITYHITAVYKVTFDIADLCFFSRNMLAD